MIELLIGVGLLGFLLLPVLVFFCVKLGRYAYLQAGELFERDRNSNESEDGNGY